MKLSKKSDTPRTYDDSQQQYKKGEPYNPRVHQILSEAIVPHGKYKGQTVKELMQDDKYWSWCDANNLITSWGMCSMRVKKIVNGKEEEIISKLVDEWGGQWLYLLEIKEPGQESKWL